jgi:hypothetical protein
MEEDLPALPTTDGEKLGEKIKTHPSMNEEKSGKHIQGANYRWVKILQKNHLQRGQKSVKIFHFLL